MYNINNILGVLQEISLGTQEVNYHLIYDIFLESKNRVNKSIFLTKMFKEISEDFSWDQEEIIQKNLDKIVNENKFLETISYDNFIKETIKMIRKEYAGKFETVIKQEIPQEINISKMQREEITLIYPFYDQIFFLESKDYYLILCLGYGD